MMRTFDSRLVLLATLMLSDVAAAAETIGAADDSSAQLQEIIVTAQKRQEDLQNVPVSVQVVGSQALFQENLNTLADVSEGLPAVHIQSNESGNSLFIRGIGSGEQPNFDQSVATFSDDIYHGRSVMSGATFLDLERIEILKGPQSTFFGNSAIAGALNIVTKRPGDTFDASGRLLYGQFGTYAAEGAIGGPVTDTFGIRIAATENGDYRGWLNNVNTGQTVPRIYNQAVRITLDWHPSENLKATWKNEYSNDHTIGTSTDQPFQLVHCPPPAPIQPSFGGLGACTQELAILAAKPGSIPSGLDNDLTDGLPGQGRTLSTYDSVLNVEFHRWGLTFTSVTGFTGYRFDAHIDYVNIPEYWGTLDYPENYNQLSQEFRVASATGGTFEYLAGLYYQKDRLVNYQDNNLPFLDSALAAFPSYLPFGNLFPSWQGEQISSAFGSLSWNVMNDLKLTGSLRASEVQKNFIQASIIGVATQLYGGIAPDPPAIQALIASATGETLGSGTYQSRSNSALMPSAGLDYKLSPDAMLYFSYRRGFKAGGYNSDVGNLPPSESTFGPEHVNAYELGLKSKWFDNRLLLNADVFRSDYYGLQVPSSVYIPTFGYLEFIRNAAETLTQGVELESQWAATKNFRLTADVTYLHSRYVSYPGATGTTLQGFCATDYVLPYCSGFPNPVPPYQNLSGRPTDDAPSWSGNLGARYTVPFNNGYRFTTELNTFFTTAYFLSGDFGGTDDPFGEVAGYVKLNGSLSLETPSGHWIFDVIGKNLTNRIIVTDGLQGIYQLSREEPRNFAVQVRFHW